MRLPLPDFKSEKIEGQFSRNINGLLRGLLMHINMFTYFNYGRVILVTRLTDLVEGESGVHTWGGGADLRLCYAVGGKEYNYFSKAEAQEIADYFNEIYKRSDGKKTIIAHSFNGGPEHFHVQIAPLVERYA